MAAMTDPILDLAQRLSRELGQEKEKLREERERLEKSFDEERSGLKEQLREKQLRIREEREGLGYDQERVDIITGRPNDVEDDVLSLNVGGESFFTQRSTLCACEDSYLANLFSGRWESSIERDSFGRFFLDFDPKCFRLLLNYLRSRRQSRLPLPAPKIPKDKEEQFWHLVEYFGLTEQFSVEEAAGSEEPAAPSIFGASFFQSALGVFRGERAPAARPYATPAPVARPVAPLAPLRTPEAPVKEAKRPGWSRRVAHRLAEIDHEKVFINDYRALAAAAAVRASRGFRAGRHAWEVTVSLCSDWSYVGFVAEDWTSLTVPIGRAPSSWGVASNGTVFACGEQITVLKDYQTNSCLRFLVDMDAGWATVDIDGHEFQLLRQLPATVFPAVSNCRSPAEYNISFLGEQDPGPKVLHLKEHTINHPL